MKGFAACALALCVGLPLIALVMVGMFGLGAVCRVLDALAPQKGVAS